jgi:hypothetical protein
MDRTGKSDRRDEREHVSVSNLSSVNEAIGQQTLAQRRAPEQRAPRTRTQWRQLSRQPFWLANFLLQRRSQSALAEVSKIQIGPAVGSLPWLHIPGCEKCESSSLGWQNDKLRAPGLFRKYPRLVSIGHRHEETVFFVLLPGLTTRVYPLLRRLN